MSLRISSAPPEWIEPSGTKLNVVHPIITRLFANSAELIGIAGQIYIDLDNQPVNVDRPSTCPIRSTESGIQHPCSETSCALYWQATKFATESDGVKDNQLVVGDCITLDSGEIEKFEPIEIFIVDDGDGHELFGTHQGQGVSVTYQYTQLVEENCTLNARERRENCPERYRCNIYRYVLDSMLKFGSMPLPLSCVHVPSNSEKPKRDGFDVYIQESTRDFYAAVDSDGSIVFPKSGKGSVAPVGCEARYNLKTDVCSQKAKCPVASKFGGNINCYGIKDI